MLMFGLAGAALRAILQQMIRAQAETNLGAEANPSHGALTTTKCDPSGCYQVAPHCWWTLQPSWDRYTAGQHRLHPRAHHGRGHRDRGADGHTAMAPATG